MKRASSLLRIMAIMIVVPIALAGITELFKTTLIWRFRIVDLVDLGITAPLYIVVLLMLNEYLLENSASPVIRVCFLISACVFLYGHAMHVSTNAINTFSTEIRNYRSIIPSDTYELIYFLDETLSHTLSFVALYGFLITLLIFDRARSKIAEIENPQWLAFGLGVLYGIGQGIALVEGQKVVLGVLLILVSFVVLIWLYKLARTTLWLYLSRGTMSMMFAGLLSALLLTLGGYALIFGDFMQPSLLGY